MHYAVPRLLQEAGQLDHFYTDICAVKGWPRAMNLVPKKLRTAGMRRLLARTPRGVPRSRITAFTNFGHEYSRRRARAATCSDATAAHLWAGETFCRKIVASGLGEAAGVYTFNSAGLELLEHARQRGCFTMMEQTIAPKRIERELMEAEQDKFPGWELPLKHDRFTAEFIAREAAEWASSDVILCGSEFVRNGITKCGGPAQRCKIVPYGVDDIFQVRQRSLSTEAKPLRVLTIGVVGLRKGSPYIQAAARNLEKSAQFRMVGTVGVLPEAEATLREVVELTGPVPRSEILAHYEWADVFLMPSICEGSATVAYEALACGLPVIATPNTGTVVRDGVEGFIVPAGDVESMVQRLEQLTSDRNLLQQMSQSALRRSKQFDLLNYRNNLLDLLPSQPQPLVPQAAQS
jgi:hypothetical protein